MSETDRAVPPAGPQARQQPSRAPIVRSSPLTAQQGCEPTVLAVLAVLRLRHPALLFHPEQEPIFHQQPQCLFRKARLTRDSIPQIAPSNGRRAHTPFPFWVI